MGKYGQIKSGKSSNPFFDDEEDVDDETFLNKAPPRSSSNFSFGSSSNSYGYQNFNNASSQEKTNDTWRDLDDRKEQLMFQKQQIEERTLQSSQRAVGLLYETEEVGISTAEELSRQREQLERTDERLDDINASLRVSERHIQNIKSVFSSIKNYFSKTPEPPKPGGRTTPTTSPNSKETGTSIESSPSSQSLPGPHPGLRVRGIETSERYSPSSIDAQLDDNLGVMGDTITRLKGLAVGLEKELDEQNSLIDRVHMKSEKADWKIQRQNKDMQRLLKK
uniref:EOG090X0MTI n=1 Tax=Lynceus sp. MCZ IZ 141354 TaxID=1930659 RepID=A0A9N6ZHJ2_9CRUS|nr:EOG090X0MTI [Lynceus sp. MCZ IZ 141354]